jgi:hypothetical protein
MNLRKLLCGLLALCLLLTMAPAALMEEAPVEEVVVELGGEIEAPEEALVEGEAAAADKLLVYEDGMDLLEDNMQMELDASDDPVELTAGADIKSVNSTYSKVASVTKAGDKVTITPKKPGTTKISVKLKEKDYNGKDSFVINLKVTDKLAPSVVKIFKDGVLVEATEDMEILDGATVLEAGVFNEENKDSEDLADALENYKILWTFTNKTKIQEDELSDTAILVTPKGEAKVKVTATAKGTNKKASFTLNIIDSNKPKSLKLVADQYGENDGYDADKKQWVVEDFDELKKAVEEDPCDYTTLVELTAIPDPDVDQPITWSIDNSKVASLTNAGVKKGYDGMVNWLQAKKPGKVTVTAKTYNGKKATITIEIIDINDVASVDMNLANVTADENLNTRDFDPTAADFEEGVDPTEIFELYDLDKDGKVIKTVLVAQAVLKNGEKEEIEDEAELAGVKWSSSKASVATVKSNKDGTATIKLLKTGTTTIKATSKNGKSKSFNLKVVDHRSPTAVYFVDDDGVTIKSFKMKAGEYAYLNPVAVAVEDPEFVTWKFKSHHTSIATVNSDGRVYAIRKGNVKIDAVAHNGKKATITVKISK